VSEQQEFDHLRAICSAALEQWIDEAHKSEIQMQTLELPVSLAVSRRFSAQRRAEAQAQDAYRVASGHLAAFVQQHLYIVN
jgi:hypothetical protein